MMIKLKKNRKRNKRKERDMILGVLEKMRMTMEMKKNLKKKNMN